jgi:hypothetical protein
MLEKDLFDKLDQIARHIKCNSRPFGGVQLILVGDFFQLPPVTKFSNAVYVCRCTLALALIVVSLL